MRAELFGNMVTCKTLNTTMTAQLRQLGEDVAVTGKGRVVATHAETAVGSWLQPMACK